MEDYVCLQVWSQPGETQAAFKTRLTNFCGNNGVRKKE
jgi:hypothetical protein